MQATKIRSLSNRPGGHLVLHKLVYYHTSLVQALFFFQAVDGIRDADVTGVQTCALPISYLNWKFVAPRLRSYTEVSNNSITLPSFLENRFKDNTHLLRIVSGIIILIFFTFYVSSGMVAGGVFFKATFGTHYLIGMILVAGITLTYT